jgi:hypothetical protein
MYLGYLGFLIPVLIEYSSIIGYYQEVTYVKESIVTHPLSAAAQGSLPQEER